MITTKCACSRTRRAGRSLTHFYDQALGPVGLKITQFSVLRTVARMEPVSISKLASEMALDRSTLGRNLGLLERQGLLTVAAGEDLRERTVGLSGRSHALLEQAVPLWEIAQQQVERLLGKPGVETLLELLAQLDDLRSSSSES